MRRVSPVLIGIVLSGCWLTPLEVEGVKAGLHSPTPTDMPPTPVPTVPPTDTGFALECVDGGTLQEKTPLAGDTLGGSDDFIPSCGETGSLDRALYYAPIQDGCHSVRALGDTGADTVIAVYESCTSESAVACNDDFFDGSADAAAFLPLTAGLPVVVVVETKGGAASWTADVAPLFTETVHSTVSGNNAGAGETLFPTMCVNAPNTSTGETFVRWLAPSAGPFTVSLSGGATFDGVLSVHRSCAVHLAEQCTDLQPANATETLSVTVEAGEEILFRVASWNSGVGDWTLDVVPGF